jgi:biofilm protein TabA
MRKTVTLKNRIGTTVRLMLFKGTDGFYLFGYDKLEDCSCIWDEFYENIDDLYERGSDEFDVKVEDWIEISEQSKGGQHDLIKSPPLV